MSEREVFIAAVFIVLGFALACGSAQEPSAVEPDSAKAKRTRAPSDLPSPFVDLDPDPEKPAVFAWYATPAPGQPGFPVRIKLDYKGSIFDQITPEAVECSFREDFIGGAGIQAFTVWGEDRGRIEGARKVLLQSLTEDGDVKIEITIEITIEKDADEKRLNWVVDDLTDRFPPCTLAPVSEYDEKSVPVEFKNLERKMFREISGPQPRVATDFKFGVRYKVSAPTE